MFLVVKMTILYIENVKKEKRENLSYVNLNQCVVDKLKTYTINTAKFIFSNLHTKCYENKLISKYSDFIYNILQFLDVYTLANISKIIFCGKFKLSKSLKEVGKYCKFDLITYMCGCIEATLDISDGRPLC